MGIFIATLETYPAVVGAKFYIKGAGFCRVEVPIRIIAAEFKRYILRVEIEAFWRIYNCNFTVYNIVLRQRLWNGRKKRGQRE